MPTIDNLLCLKEIFGVSADEILGCESKPTEQMLEPSETYRLNFSEQEFVNVNKITGRAWNRGITISVTIIAIVMLLLMLSNSGDAFMGFLLGALPLSILFIRGIKANNSAVKKRNETAAKSLYEYRIYEDHFTVAIIRDNETVTISKFCFSEIEQIYNMDKYIAVVIRGEYYLLRKSDIKKDSVFYSCMKNNPTKTVTPKPADKWRVISIVMFIASLLSIFGAIAAVTVMTQRNKSQIENMWIFYVFALIPAASATIGFILKAKGYKYKKNVIAGIIMTVLLCIYGSFSFIFADMYDHSDEPIIRIKQMLKIDIPEYTQINTTDWTKETQSGGAEYLYYFSDVYFGEEAENLELQIREDSRWLSEKPSELIGISSPLGQTVAYDNILIYNSDTEEYNTLPEKDGTYHFISITYDSKEKQMRIAEYDIDYVS